MNISDEGELRGTSEAGGRIEGEVAERPRQDGFYALTGTITPPNGDLLELDLATPSAVEDGEYRWVVLSEGEVKGARKNVATGSSSGYIDPGSNL